MTTGCIAERISMPNRALTGVVAWKAATTDSSQTGRRMGMPQQIDDFTIALRELTDMGACDLKVYNNLDRLWRLVERYKMTAPITIGVVDKKARYVRAICGNHDQTAGWQLNEETSAVTQTSGAEVEFPLTIRVQDARGNVLKMRLQLELPKPNSP
jgi:hypothetical protein